MSRDDIMFYALVAITTVKPGDDAHARCLAIADKALSDAEEAEDQDASATPSQRLDAATAERRRKALREALEHVDSIAGEMNGVAERAHLIDADDAAMNLADAFGVEFAPGWDDEVAALATGPHQHGGKGA